MPNPSYTDPSPQRVAENPGDAASMIFEAASQPSPYLASLISTSPATRRAQTINLDNPHNRAVAYPAYHIGIDAKDAPSASEFSVRMAEINDLESKSLASTATGRPNGYRPRAVVAAERREKLLAKSARSTKGKEKTRVDPAPDREHTPSSTDEAPTVKTPRRRRAAIAGEKKRKRASRGHENNAEEPEAEIVVEAESEENIPVPKRRLSTRKSTTSVVVSCQTPTNEATGFGPASLLRKRDSGIKVPKSIDEAGKADRMLWDWRYAGKPWAAITRKWTEMTGRTPGKSTLSVRFIKLQENFAQTGGADDILLLKYKEEAEAEMEDELWQKVSDKIMANHDANVSANQLRRRYSALRQSGFEIGAELDMDQALVDDRECHLPFQEAASNLEETQVDPGIETADVLAQPETAETPAPLVDYSNSESDV